MFKPLFVQCTVSVGTNMRICFVWLNPLNIILPAVQVSRYIYTQTNFQRPYFQFDIEGLMGIALHSIIKRH